MAMLIKLFLKHKPIWAALLVAAREMLLAEYTEVDGKPNIDNVERRTVNTTMWSAYDNEVAKR